VTSFFSPSHVPPPRASDFLSKVRVEAGAVFDGQKPQASRDAKVLWRSCRAVGEIFIKTIDVLGESVARRELRSWRIAGSI
jgi:hypothetical protein